MTGSFPYTNPYISQQQPSLSNPYLSARHHQQQQQHQNSTHHGEQHAPPALSLSQKKQHRTAPCITGILQRLVSDPFQQDLIESLQQAIRQQQQQQQQQQQPQPTSSWDWSSIALFMEWTGAMLLSDMDHEFNAKRQNMYVSCLTLVAHVMDASWSDEQVYGALQVSITTSDDTTKSITVLQCMENVWSKLDAMKTDTSSSVIKSALLCAWTSALVSLHRLEQVTMEAPCPVVASSPTSVVFAVDWLTKDNHHNDDDQFASSWQEQHFMSQDCISMACVNALRLYMTAHDFDTLDDFDDLPTATVKALMNKLQNFVSRLAATTAATTTDETRLGLASLHVLVLLQEASNDATEQVIASIVQAVIVVPWMPEQQQEYLRRSLAPWTTRTPNLVQWAIPLLMDMCRVEQGSSKVTDIIRAVIGRETGDWMEVPALDSLDESSMASLVFLLRHCPTMVRSQLMLGLQQQNNLLEALLQRCQQHKSIQSASLVDTLVRDRQSNATHDELSRRLWQSIDCKFVAKCLDTAVLMQSDKLPSTQPLTFRLLDTAALLLSCEPVLAPIILANISTQSVESLVELTVRPDQANDGSFRGGINKMDTSLSFDWGDSTPPANNLSRIDDADLSFQQHSAPLEASSSKLPRGVEPAIAMAAAIALACMASCKAEFSDGRIVLMQGRIIEAVNTYMERALDATVLEKIPALAMTRHQLFLMTKMATKENLDFYATLVHTSDVAQRQTLLDLLDDKQRREVAIDAYQASDKRLRNENFKLNQKLAKQTVDFQRQISQNKRVVAQHAKQLVEVHQTERNKAEDRANELSSRVMELEDRLRTAEQAVSACKQAEVEAKTEVKDMASKLVQLEKKEQSASQRAESSSKKVLDLSRELQSTKSTIDTLLSNDKQMKEEILSHQESLAQADESVNEMRNSLESLFADLVNMCKLYELKEREESLSRHNGDAAVVKLQKTLEAERSMYAELEERYKLTEASNDHLSRKYLRVREKLDNEREERAKEKQASRKVNDSKRSENVSYLNHLDRSKISGKTKHRGGVLDVRMNG